MDAGDGAEKVRYANQLRQPQPQNHPPISQRNEYIVERYRREHVVPESTPLAIMPRYVPRSVDERVFRSLGVVGGREDRIPSDEIEKEEEVDDIVQDERDREDIAHGERSAQRNHDHESDDERRTEEAPEPPDEALRPENMLLTLAVYADMHTMNERAKPEDVEFS